MSSYNFNPVESDDDDMFLDSPAFLDEEDEQDEKTGIRRFIVPIVAILAGLAVAVGALWYLHKDDSVEPAAKDDKASSQTAEAEKLADAEYYEAEPAKSDIPTKEELVASLTKDISTSEEMTQLMAGVDEATKANLTETYIPTYTQCVVDSVWDKLTDADKASLHKHGIKAQGTSATYDLISGATDACVASTLEAMESANGVQEVAGPQPETQVETQQQ